MHVAIKFKAPQHVYLRIITGSGTLLVLSLPGISGHKQFGLEGLKLDGIGPGFRCCVNQPKGHILIAIMVNTSFCYNKNFFFHDMYETTQGKSANRRFFALT